MIIAGELTGTSLSSVCLSVFVLRSFTLKGRESARVATGPATAREFDHSADMCLEVTTYFLVPLMKSANGCSSDVGQCCGHSS